MPSSQLRGFVVGAAIVLLVGGVLVAATATPEVAPSSELVETAEQATETAATTAPSPSSVVVAPSTTTTSTTTTSTTTTTTSPSTTTTSRPSTTTTTTTTTPPSTTTTSTTPPSTTTTSPSTTTTTTVPGWGDPPDSLPMTREEVVAILVDYFAAEDVELAAWVVRCESVYDAAAVHPSGTVVGLFQHKLTAWEYRAEKAGFAGEPWWNPVANSAAAALLWYDSLGPSHHWPSCYPWAVSQVGG